MPSIPLRRVTSTLNPPPFPFSLFSFPASIFKPLYNNFFLFRARGNCWWGEAVGLCEVRISSIHYYFALIIRLFYGSAFLMSDLWNIHSQRVQICKISGRDLNTGWLRNFRKPRLWQHLLTTQLQNQLKNINRFSNLLATPLSRYPYKLIPLNL